MQAWCTTGRFSVPGVGLACIWAPSVSEVGVCSRGLSIGLCLRPTLCEVVHQLDKIEDDFGAWQQSALESLQVTQYNSSGTSSGSPNCNLDTVRYATSAYGTLVPESIMHTSEASMLGAARVKLSRVRSRSCPDLKTPERHKPKWHFPTTYASTAVSYTRELGTHV